MKKKIILATDRKFWAYSQGSTQRISSLLGYLISSGYSVSLFYVGSISPNDMRQFQKKYPEVPIYTSPTFLQFLFSLKQRIFHKLMRKRPDEEKRLEDYYSLINKFFFQRACKKMQPDILLIEYIRLAYLIDGIRGFPGTKVIDTHDVMWKRCLLFHNRGLKHWIDIDREEESEILRKFDVIIAIQKKDAGIFQEMLPESQIITVPHAAEIKNIPTQNEILTISYIAIDSLPNIHAIQNFLQHVWPKVYSLYPDRIRLKIAGNICRSIQANPDFDLRGVDLLGYLDDLETIYSQSDIIVNPVSFGGGLKIKNVEALCHSKPLITTSIGAEGMEDGINKAFLVCDTSEEMQKKLIALIENKELQRLLSQRAYEYALENFTPQKAYEELLKIGIVQKPI